MDLKEKNWQNFAANHLRDWHGIWTRYSPQGDVIESFQSLRSFRSNPEQTEIFHTNRYIYADGSIKEANWQSNKQDKVFDDGIVHPAFPLMRSLYFEQGAAIWTAKQLEPDSIFGIELFFMFEKLRHSVGIIYDQQGVLSRIANIREDTRGFPSQYWSKEIEQVSERNLSGNWQGISMTMSPDLKISESVLTQLDWGWEGHKTFFLPDGVSISCPDKVSVNTPFTLAANWLVTDSKMQQLKVKYDQFGTFSALTFEQLHL